MYYDHFSLADRCASLDKDPDHANSANQTQKRDQREYEDDVDLLNAHHQFLEIETGNVTVTAVATQGDAMLKQYVKKYKLSFQKERNGPWQFYLGSQMEKDPRSILDATPLTGNTDATSVRKNYITPFEATAIRIHPVEWVGVSMALRAEVFTCLESFDFSPLEEFVNHLNRQGATPEVCSALTNSQRIQSSFEHWTLGRGGSGAIYQTAYREYPVEQDNNSPADKQDGNHSERAALQSQMLTENTKLKSELAIAKQLDSARSATIESMLQSSNQTELLAKLQEALADMNKKAAAERHRLEKAKLGESYTDHAADDQLIADLGSTESLHHSLRFKAYQQRTVTGGGLMTKQLICFSQKGLSTTKQCCVRKLSKKFSGTQWTDQELMTLLA